MNPRIEEIARRLASASTGAEAEISGYRNAALGAEIELGLTLAALSRVSALVAALQKAAEGSVDSGGNDWLSLLEVIAQQTDQVVEPLEKAEMSIRRILSEV